jgi:DNA-binding transcriptional MerR regulator
LLICSGSLYQSNRNNAHAHHRKACRGKFNLSRSTLLYYDRIGLLKPSGRTHYNYRIYTRSEVRRLEKICLFRQAGLDLTFIAATLSTSESSLADILELQIDLLNQKIKDLRCQQHLIVGLLKEIKRENFPIKVMDKQSWVRLLKSAGMDEKAMGNWHQAFERLSPDAHQHFLESLGISKDEVKAIRRWSKDGTPD